MTDPRADNPYTDADVEFVARALHATHGMEGEPTPACLDDATVVLLALAAAGWRPGSALAKQVEETMEVAAELAEARTTADEMTRAVKRLVGERNDALAGLRDAMAELKDRTAEAKGARSDYEQLKGFNAELADERDRLRRELDKIRRAHILGRP